MGGVGTMRSAAKVAGLGIISSYYGSCSSVSLAERVVEARNSVVPFSVSPPYPSPSPSAEQLFKNSTVPIPATVKISASSVRRPSSWEIIDWEFIAKEEGLLLETAMDHTPAISLGDVPSVDEALEATCDLRDALETLRFSPDTASGDRLVSDIQASNLTRSVIRKNERSGSPVFQAFSLMRDDPMIQNVVVSLASDKNIWDAVTKNKEFIQFCKRMNKNAPLPTSEVVDEESA